MGQGQSSGNSAQQEVPIKTSYYELLALERTATEDEIKKAYRRKALELHPDRNYGREEEATRLFAEISAAYEVLSDPQERAWYDGHESEILRGGGAGDGGAGGGEGHFEGSIRVTTAEEVTALIGMFNGRTYYNNSPSGFFGFLREYFEHLAKEEEAAAMNAGEEATDFPSFGHQEDKHEDVVSDFYKGWSGFSTRKSFAWKDKWRLSDAPDRWTKRAMQKENAKIREEGIREFNYAVRALVAFVRKRDPRYRPNVGTEAERQKALKEASAAQAKRAREANAAKADGAVPEWARSRGPEEDDGSEFSEEEEEESEQEHFECVACRKTFKSERQFEAHERSKKHQKAVFQLKKQMRKDNAKLGLDEDLTSSGVITPQDDDSAGEKETLPKVEKLNLGEDEDASDVSTDAEGEKLSSRAPKKAKPASTESQDDSEDEDDVDSDYAPRSKVSSRLNGSSTEQAPLASTAIPTEPPPPPVNTNTIRPEADDAEAPAEKKLGKAAQKRLKKAAKAAEADAEAENSRFRCAKCGADFPNKTRLFQHIKENPKHAALKTDAGKGKRGKR